MKLIEDLTHEYNIAVVDDDISEEMIYRIIKDYAVAVFASYKMLSYENEDVKKGIIGIEVCDIQHNNIPLVHNSCYFYGYVTKDGEVVKKW